MSDIPRNRPCPCGSGKKYKYCCGEVGVIDEKYWMENSPGRFPFSLLGPELSYLVENEPVCEWSGEKMPPGVLVTDIGDEYGWRGIARAIAKKPNARKAGVMNRQTKRKMSEARVTSIVRQEELTGPISTLVKRLYVELVEPFYNKKLRWYQMPQVLRYKPGGYYRPHADSDELNKANKWERVNDRHLSLLLYLDDNFEGGDLTFPNFNFRISPRPGMLIAFPSDGRYLHAATPVDSGRRHAIVSWSSVHGGECFRNVAPSDAIFMNQ